MSTQGTKLFQNDTSRRLEWLKDDQNVSVAELARRAGIERSYLSAMINHGKAVSLNAAMSISKNMNINLNWLLRGIGKPYQSETVDVGSAEFVLIRRFSVEASAGHGSAVSTEDETGYYGFKREWLERRSLSANSLSVISVSGDSMEPDLRDGDLILVDHATTSLDDGNIYAVRFSDGLYVKRIQHLPGDKVHLISSNRNYPPIEIAHPVADGVEVIGRVVASMHEW